MNRASLRPWLLYKCAQTLAVLALNERAVEMLEHLVRDHPGYVRAWSTLGYLHAGKQRLEPALSAFERALALSPEDAALLFNTAYTLQRLARHDKAIALFQRAIDRDRHLDRAWYGMGLSLMATGNHAAAVERLGEAARLQPFNPYAGYQLAAALFRVGRHEDVQAEYERVRGFDPKISAQMRRDFGTREP